MNMARKRGRAFRQREGLVHQGIKVGTGLGALRTGGRPVWLKSVRGGESDWEWLQRGPQGPAHEESMSHA